MGSNPILSATFLKLNMFFTNATIRRSTQVVTGINREAPPVAEEASDLWRSRRFYARRYAEAENRKRQEGAPKSP